MVVRRTPAHPRGDVGSRRVLRIGERRGLREVRSGERHRPLLRPGVDVVARLGDLPPLHHVRMPEQEGEQAERLHQLRPLLHRAGEPLPHDRRGRGEEIGARRAAPPPTRGRCVARARASAPARPPPRGARPPRPATPVRPAAAGRRAGSSVCGCSSLPPAAG